MKTYKIKSGFRVGISGFIGTVLFLSLIAWVYYQELRPNGFGGFLNYLLYAAVAMSFIPVLSKIPAMVKSVSIIQTQNGYLIDERGLFGKRKIFVTPNLDVSFSLRIMVSPYVGSCIKVSGDLNEEIGKGLACRDLTKLHSLILKLSEQDVDGNPLAAP